VTLQPLVLIDPAGTEIEWRFAGKPIRHINQIRNDAAAKAVAWALQKFNEGSVGLRIDHEIDSRRSEIEDGIRNWSDNNPDGICYEVEKVGALLQVILSRPSNWPGNPPISFKDLIIAEYGLDPSETVMRYMGTSNLLPGPDEGTEEFWQYFWFKLDS
jgi:hypothetical protein